MSTAYNEYEIVSWEERGWTYTEIRHTCGASVSCNLDEAIKFADEHAKVCPHPRERAT